MAIESKDLLVWVKAMSRGQALPLDASEIYASMAEAEAYASSPIAYAGQTIKVLQDDGKYHEYILQPNSSGYVLEDIFSIDDVSSEYIVHGSEKNKLSNIIETYILNIDYNKLLAFDTTEILFGENVNAGTSAVLGKAILGQMVLG